MSGEQGERELTRDLSVWIPHPGHPKGGGLPRNHVHPFPESKKLAPAALPATLEQPGGHSFLQAHGAPKDGCVPWHRALPSPPRP